MAPRGENRALLALEVFLSLGALVGGGLLVAGPDGHLLGLPSALLERTPFRSFLIPGLVLATLLGLAPAWAAWLTVRGHRWAPGFAVGVGLALIGWIVVEMVLLPGAQTLAWSLYLVLGCAIVALGFRAVERARA
jgi:hypothetical protein